MDPTACRKFMLPTFCLTALNPARRRKFIVWIFSSSKFVVVSSLNFSNPSTHHSNNNKNNNSSLLRPDDFAVGTRADYVKTCGNISI